MIRWVRRTRGIVYDSAHDVALDSPPEPGARTGIISGQYGGTAAYKRRRILTGRAAAVSTLAGTAGAVFSIAFLTAVAPLTSNSVPRVAQIDAAGISQAQASTPAAHTAALTTDITSLWASALRGSVATPNDALAAGVDLSAAFNSADDMSARGIPSGPLTTAFDVSNPAQASFETPQTDPPTTDFLVTEVLTEIPTGTPGPQTDPAAPAYDERAYGERAYGEKSGPPAPIRQTIHLEIKSGDTIGGVLNDLGIPREDAHAATKALAKHFSPRDLRVGHDLEIELETLPVEVASLGNDTAQTRAPSLVGLSLKPDSQRWLRVSYNAQEATFGAQEIVRDLTQRVVRAQGVIEGSLFGAASRVGVPNAVMVEFMKLYAYSVDFQREIQKGDSFEVFYTEYTNDDGDRVRAGDILFASLSVRQKPLNLWRFEAPDDGTVDYFNEQGQSSKKFLMRTPIEGARISSGFGNRRHPILGYNKMHTGTDFAAPTGTPIYAAGNGTVVQAGWHGGYGKYVKIRHANGYETAYAHMSRISKGIKPGARVSQGQTIGRVGSTGRSTGPHLHYEVLVRGKKVNPMTIRVPTGRKLEGEALAAFQDTRTAVATHKAQVAPLTLPLETASVEETDQDNSLE